MEGERGNSRRLILPILLTLLILILLGLNLFGGWAPSTPTAVPTRAKATVPEEYQNTPGLLLYGYVRSESGEVMANVAICRSYASYPGDLVATTGEDGYYSSKFAYMPGDEMVGVWALADGYIFEPEMEGWRHYAGQSVRQIDFVAREATEGDVPGRDCR